MNNPIPAENLPAPFHNLPASFGHVGLGHGDLPEAEFVLVGELADSEAFEEDGLDVG